MRKPHSKARLFRLPPEQTELIASWLLDEGLSYRQAAARAKEELGVEVCYQKFTQFWNEVCVPRKLQRSSVVASTVQTLADSLQTDWQQTNAQLIGQKIFEMLASPETDIKTVCALGGVLEKVKTRDLHEKAFKAKTLAEKQRYKQKERQMLFAREKFEFDAVEAVLKQAGKVKTISTDRALSSDEKREQLRRLLFPQAFTEDGPLAKAAQDAKGGKQEDG